MRRPPRRTAVAPPRSSAGAGAVPRVTTAAPHPRRPPAGRQVARIVDDGDATLLDLVDNLLNRGVVVNADVVLALADVDLVYLRLSALLCAADRILHDARR